MDTTTNTDLDTTEDTNSEVGAVIVVIGAALAVIGLGAAVVGIWKAVDRRLQLKYAAVVPETPEEPKDKKTTK